MWMSEDDFSSHLLACGFQQLNPVRQAWQQAPLLAGPSCRPHVVSQVFVVSVLSFSSFKADSGWETFFSSDHHSPLCQEEMKEAEPKAQCDSVLYLTQSPETSHLASSHRVGTCWLTLQTWTWTSSFEWNSVRLFPVGLLCLCFSANLLHSPDRIWLECICIKLSILHSNGQAKCCR